MTSPATPPEQRQPLTRREAREMRERAEREAQERAAQEHGAPAQAAPQAQAPAERRPVEQPRIEHASAWQTGPQPASAQPANPRQASPQPATSQQASTQQLRTASPRPEQPRTQQLRTEQLRVAPQQAPSAAATAEAPHPDLAWLHEAASGSHDVGRRGGQRGGRGGKPPKPPRQHGRGRRAVMWVVSTLVILGLVGGGALFAWRTFQPQVHSVVAHFQHTPTDYTGSGTGTVDITINQGDTGEAIAATLAKAGVTMTPQAFYQLLLTTKPDPVFQPGVYQLRKHMSAASALTLLQDPKSKLEHTLLIREGAREATILADASTATGIPLAQLKAAASKPASYGLPPQAKTLEGFLFPATYTFNPGITANQLISQLVSRAKDAWAEDGVPASNPTELWRTVVLASVVQLETGPNPGDPPKIAGVFDNRIAKGMPLQSDATVHYGLNKFDTVWTTDAQRADASNPYNTYAHTGLPPGPIGNPGDAALKAAVHPQGDYLYFTVVNLQTGETAFSTTIEGQNANVAKLQEWCQKPENASYCE